MDRGDRESVEQGTQGTPSVPVVETVVRTREVETGRATSQSVEHSTKGRGKVVALVVVPVLLVLLVVLGYWALAVFKVNSEADGSQKNSGWHVPHRDTWVEVG
jgi:hypothetical protein